MTHIGPHPTRLRGAHNFLSHLPLHSQQLSKAPSQLIPIGGIHMIQPRSPLPLYSLLSPPTAATRTSATPRTRFSLLPQQDALATDAAAAPGARPRSSQSDEPLRKNQRCGIQLPSGRLEVSTDVYPETTRGQKKTPSSQTPL